MEKWKESFDYKFTMLGHKGIWGHVNSVEDVKDFISTEIIEKIIDEIPDVGTVQTYSGNQTNILDIQTVKDQLKSKFL